MFCSRKGLNTNGSSHFGGGFKAKTAMLDITNVKAHSFWKLMLQILKSMFECLQYFIMPFRSQALQLCVRGIGSSRGDL